VSKNRVGRAERAGCSTHMWHLLSRTLSRRHSCTEHAQKLTFLSLKLTFLSSHAPTCPTVRVWERACLGVNNQSKYFRIFQKYVCACLGASVWEPCAGAERARGVRSLLPAGRGGVRPTRSFGWFRTSRAARRVSRHPNILKYSEIF
jgi:hypothetical protein